MSRESRSEFDANNALQDAHSTQLTALRALARHFRRIASVRAERAKADPNMAVHCATALRLSDQYAREAREYARQMRAEQAA